MTRKICLTPRVHGVGGMVSFQAKLSAGLAARGIEVTQDLADPGEAVLIIGGTRDLPGLLRAKRRGARLVQRLDGMNWIHRKRSISLKHTLRAEYGNFALAFIRRFIADRIIYQSAFSRDWWERVHGPARVAHAVIHNGVDLSIYSPQGSGERPADRMRLLVVEGSMGGGYDMGLENAVRLAELLADQGFPMELMVVGRVEPAHQSAWDARSRVPIAWAGLVPRERIPEIDRSAHLFYSADLHPACPNAVIEALACGLPVAAFDTGSLAELVPPGAGAIAPYGADPWNLERPDVPALAADCAPLLRDLPRYQAGARAYAESAFGLDTMVEKYMKELLD
jgi:glycosyltransferase involved in cell wall biosynthesis